MAAIGQWTPEQVVAWMRSLQMDSMVMPFLDNQIDGSLLIQLDDEMLQVTHWKGYTTQGS